MGWDEKDKVKWWKGLKEWRRKGVWEFGKTVDGFEQYNILLRCFERKKILLYKNKTHFAFLSYIEVKACRFIANENVYKLLIKKVVLLNLWILAHLFQLSKGKVF